jgi:hypothetical protein
MQISPQKTQDLLRRSCQFAQREACSRGICRNSGAARGAFMELVRNKCLCGNKQKEQQAVEANTSPTAPASAPALNAFSFRL